MKPLKLSTRHLSRENERLGLLLIDKNCEIAFLNRKLDIAKEALEFYENQEKNIINSQSRARIALYKIKG